MQGNLHLIAGSLESAYWLLSGAQAISLLLIRTKWRFWTSRRHSGCTSWRSQLLCLTQLLFIRNNSFLLLNALTILMMISSGKYWTLDPKDTTITPCSADWTISSISCGKRWDIITIVCNLKSRYASFLCIPLPLDNGFASFFLQPKSHWGTKVLDDQMSNQH